MHKKIVILGAGISGLAVAYLIKHREYDVTVLEKKNDVGGTIETSNENGFLFEHGVNNALDSNPIISKLVNELNLEDQIVYANKIANKRYILRNNTLHALPLNPTAFLKTKLFSTKAKLRLISEPLISRSKEGYYQSVAEFVSRRLGREILDYAVNPFVAEVYAGNPENLSVKSAFPKLYALEEDFGSLIVGTFKSVKQRRQQTNKPVESGKMFSFKDGMTVFPKALAKCLSNSVFTQAEVKKIEKHGNQYKIVGIHKGEKFSLLSDVVISTVPAFAAAELLGDLDETLKKHLLGIYYPPLLILYLVYKRKDINQPLDGFGFLVPTKEKKSFLASIWTSEIFPNTVFKDNAAFTIFVGGARDPEILSIDKEILFMRVSGEFETIMKISGEPIYTSYKFWTQSIPQYSIGHIQHENYFNQFEQKFPGIFLHGSYKGGMSFGDCIKNSALIAEKAVNYIS